MNEEYETIVIDENQLAQLAQQKEPYRVYPPELIETILDVEDLLDRIEVYLKGGKIEIKEGQKIKIIPQKEEWLLNEEGIKNILEIMRKRLDPIIYSTTSVNEEFIATEVYFFHLDLVRLLAKNAHKWKLKREKFHELCDFLVSAFEAILRKSLNAYLLSLLFGHPQRTERKGFFRIFG